MPYREGTKSAPLMYGVTTNALKLLLLAPVPPPVPVPVPAPAPVPIQCSKSQCKAEAQNQSCTSANPEQYENYTGRVRDEYECATRTSANANTSTSDRASATTSAGSSAGTSAGTSSNILQGDRTYNRSTETLVQLQNCIGYVHGESQCCNISLVASASIGAPPAKRRCVLNLRRSASSVCLAGPR